MLNKFGSSTSGLGDLLLLTSICKYFPNKFTIQLPTNKEKYSILFQNLANIEITNDIFDLPDIGSGHYATRKLRNFFPDNAEDLDNRPLVLYTDEDSERWADAFLKSIANPIIFTPHCSKEWATVRNIPVNLSIEIQKMIKDADLNCITMINLENEYKEQCENKLENLDLKKMICLFRKVGMYIGCNTGDEHLAVSVGAKTIVYQPSNNPLFNPVEWNYSHADSNYIYF
jgi:hypothetical protein